jgi:hypothetical protein
MPKRTLVAEPQFTFMPITAHKRARLLKKLQEQLRFVENSCRAFDVGAEEEAIRIATSLRVIFHNTQMSTSIFAYLNMNSGKVLSSSRGHGDFKDYLQYKIHYISTEPMKCIPMLGTHFRELPFQDWWENEPVFIHGGKQYFRKTIVLSAANKDGGAHVDDELETYYEVLSAGEYALGITADFQFQGPAPFEQGVTHYAKNAHLALLRQFAHETLFSAKHFSWLGK